MVGKGKLAVFEGSSISETERGHTHQNRCKHAHDINPYMHEFFESDSNRLNFLMTMDYSPLYQYLRN